jgi:hypothetical protein
MSSIVSTPDSATTRRAQVSPIMDDLENPGNQSAMFPASAIRAQTIAAGAAMH